MCGRQNKSPKRYVFESASKNYDKGDIEDVITFRVLRWVEYSELPL